MVFRHKTVLKFIIFASKPLSPSSRGKKWRNQSYIGILVLLFHHLTWLAYWEWKLDVSIYIYQCSIKENNDIIVPYLVDVVLGCLLFVQYLFKESCILHILCLHHIKSANFVAAVHNSLEVEEYSCILGKIPNLSGEPFQGCHLNPGPQSGLGKPSDNLKKGQYLI